MMIEYTERCIMWITPYVMRGARIYTILSQLRMELNYYVVQVEAVFHSYPELRFACMGLSGFKTYGLVFEKRSCKICSFKHDFNLLK